jgi:hypothetical protein
VVSVGVLVENNFTLEEPATIFRSHQFPSLCPHTVHFLYDIPENSRGSLINNGVLKGPHGGSFFVGVLTTA